ncbi:MAG TPA: hypothetical protein PK052_01840 [Anaerohalosphaeraceae bacterium]|nr:hypothetical protein [Phycisphaerae bacterium]HOK95704.1 hypothetical protein [Anaerohalosphaeraceae bacterium]HOL30697.1 hypothetical protein [Anaerohalosphaeraceae bacterium]HOM75129.1 hypothetical protein [Anaerohalosphaeraceae bacterium]HPC63438.1 hypothetical protein [Anaerohalosphaeraceae bacterium]
MKTSKHTQNEHPKERDSIRLLQDRIDSAVSQQDVAALQEELLESMQSNPLGRLLKVIASLPEVRSEKIERARRHIEQNDDCWDTKMDLVLDKVLEELINEE